MTYTNATTLVEFLRARLDADGSWAQDVLSTLNVGQHGFARRVLADVEAKRRIVDLLSQRVDDGINYDSMSRYRFEEVLQLLALPFASHPDYDPSWRPAEVTA